MKKRILSLMIVAAIVAGCGSGSNDTAKDAESEVRLSKDDYMKQMTEKATEMQSLQASIAQEKDPDKAIESVTKVVDEMIDLKGPKDLDGKEKAIDDTLEEFKDLIKSAKELAKDPSNASDYITKLTDLATKLNEAQAAYQ